MTNLLYEENEVFGGWFNHWRKVRVKKIEDVLGQDWFKGKKILELGAGFGNVGLYFKSLGADVTMTDARNECLEVILKKDKDANVILLDQDSKWELPEQYDLIIHFGLSYNLKNWKQDLISTINHSRLYVAFETAVNKFYQDICFQIRNYDPHHEFHGPLNGIGSLPSVSSIEKILSIYEYTRYDDEDLNINNLIYTNTSFREFEFPRDEHGSVILEPYCVDGWDNPFVSGGRKFWILKKERYEQ